MKTKFASHFLNEAYLHFMYGLLMIAILVGCVGQPITVEQPARLIGDVLELHPGTTVLGIMKALESCQCGKMLSDGRNVLFYWWQQGQGYGMTGMKINAADPVGVWRYASNGKAMLTDSQSMAYLENGLREAGWKVVTKDQLPSDFVNMVRAIAAGATQLATAGVSWCSVILVPAGLFPDAPSKGVQQ